MKSCGALSANSRSAGASPRSRRAKRAHGGRLFRTRTAQIAQKRRRVRLFAPLQRGARMHGEGPAARREEGTHRSDDLARLARVAAHRLRKGQVQPLRKPAQRQPDRLPRARVHFADLGRELDLQGAQAVDVAVGEERRIRPRGRDLVRHARGEHRLCRGAAAFGDPADEHRVAVLRDERNFQPRKPFGEQRRELLGGKDLPARERLRLAEHAQNALVPARGECGLCARALPGEGARKLLLRLFAAERGEHGAHGAAVRAARHGRAHAFERG